MPVSGAPPAGHPYASEIEAERRDWYEIADLVRSLTPRECLIPGYYRNPDWTVRDVVGHLGTWLAQAQTQFERISAGTYEGHDFDIDGLNAPMRPEEFREPRWARFLFASSSAAWLWLVVRLYEAYIFLPAGWAKITSGKWLFGDGSPIQGLVGGAATSKDTPDWYVWFLQNVVQPNASLFATLVALGEFAVGLGLLVGLLTGIAAFGGVFLNANFVLAGALV